MTQKPKVEPKDKIDRLLEAYNKFETRIKEEKEKRKKGNSA